MDHEDAVYIWLVADWSGTGGSAGQPAMGTLSDYVEAWTKAYYASDGLPTELYTYTHLDQGPVKHVVVIDRGVVDENDEIPYTASVNGESVGFRIDGRA